MTHSVYFNFRRKLHRRTILRGAGVGIAVPWLSAMTEALQHTGLEFDRFATSTGTMTGLESA